MSPFQWDGSYAVDLKLQQWWQEVANANHPDKIEERLTLTAVIFWNPWKAKNAWLFNLETWEPKRLLDHAILDWQEYLEAYN